MENSDVRREEQIIPKTVKQLVQDSAWGECLKAQGVIETDEDFGLIRASLLTDPDKLKQLEPYAGEVLQRIAKRVPEAQELGGLKLMYRVLIEKATRNREALETNQMSSLPEAVARNPHYLQVKLQMIRDGKDDRISALRKGGDLKGEDCLKKRIGGVYSDYRYKLGCLKNFVKEKVLAVDRRDDSRLQDDPMILVIDGEIEASFKEQAKAGDLDAVELISLRDRNFNLDGWADSPSDLRLASVLGDLIVAGLEGAVVKYEKIEWGKIDDMDVLQREGAKVEKLLEEIQKDVEEDKDGLEARLKKVLAVLEKAKNSLVQAKVLELKQAGEWSKLGEILETLPEGFKLSWEAVLTSKAEEKEGDLEGLMGYASVLRRVQEKKAGRGGGRWQELYLVEKFVLGKIAVYVDNQLESSRSLDQLIELKNKVDHLTFEIKDDSDVVKQRLSNTIYESGEAEGDKMIAEVERLRAEPEDIPDRDALLSAQVENLGLLIKKVCANVLTGRTSLFKHRQYLERYKQEEDLLLI